MYDLAISAIIGAVAGLYIGYIWLDSLLLWDKLFRSAVVLSISSLLTLWVVKLGEWAS